MLEILHKIMPIIYAVYFGINCITVGISIDPENGKTNLSAFSIIMFLFFGIFIITAVFIWDYWITPLLTTLRVKFFWQFIFTKKWSSCSKNVLMNLNRFLYNPSIVKKSLKNRVYRYSIALVFKRNNFTPVEYKSGLEWLETIPKTFQVKVISPDAWYNDKDFIKTKITKKQFIENMRASAISHAITFEIDKF